MVISCFEDIKTFLPSYLSEESLDKLFEGISQFIQESECVSNLYTRLLCAERLIFQGDAFSDVPIVDLPDTEIYRTKVLVLSNTCDLDTQNKRNSSLPINLSYVPIIPLGKYVNLLRENGIDELRITGHVTTLKQQRYTHLIYFPAHPSGPNEDAVALLDHTCSCRPEVIQVNNIAKQRLFTLNNFGFYLFLLKLSIHFSRIRESVDRI